MKTARRTGLTLLEVMVATVILMVVMAVGLDAARRSIKTSGTATTLAALRSESRQTVDSLVRQLQSCPPRRFKQRDPASGLPMDQRPWVVLPTGTVVSYVGYQVVVGIDTAPLGLFPPQLPQPIYLPANATTPRYLKHDAPKRALRLALTDGTPEITLAEFVDTFEFSIDAATGNGNIRLVLSAIDPGGRLDVNKNPDRLTVEYGRLFQTHNSDSP